MPGGKGSGLFECKHCHRIFPRQEALAGHIGSAHGRRKGSRRRRNPGREPQRTEAKPRFKCRVCGEGFTALHEISAHMRSAHRGSVPQPVAASGTEQITCAFCGGPLPIGAGILVASFIEEGLAQDVAEKLASRAYGLLRVHERSG